MRVCVCVLLLNLYTDIFSFEDIHIDIYSNKHVFLHMLMSAVYTSIILWGGACVVFITIYIWGQMKTSQRVIVILLHCLLPRCRNDNIYSLES